MDTISCRALAVDAHLLANRIGRSVYDAMYLALVIRAKTRMLTADERLANALKVLPQIPRYIQMVQTLRSGH